MVPVVHPSLVHLAGPHHGLVVGVEDRNAHPAAGEDERAVESEESGTDHQPVDVRESVATL